MFDFGLLETVLPDPCLVGDRIERSEGRAIGQFRLDSEILVDMSISNYGVAVTGFSSPRRIVRLLRRLCESCPAGSWVLIASSQERALSLWNNFRVGGNMLSLYVKNKNFDSPLQHYVTVPESLPWLCRPARLRETRLLGFLIIDPNMSLLQERRWGPGNTYKPLQLVSEVRARFTYAQGGLPIIVWTQQQAISFPGSAYAHGLGLERMIYVQGESLSTWHPE